MKKLFIILLSLGSVAQAETLDIQSAFRKQSFETITNNTQVLTDINADELRTMLTNAITIASNAAYTNANARAAAISNALHAIMLTLTSTNQLNASLANYLKLNQGTPQEVSGTPAFTDGLDLRNSFAAKTTTLLINAAGGTGKITTDLKPLTNGTAYTYAIWIKPVGDQGGTTLIDWSLASLGFKLWFRAYNSNLMSLSYNGTDYLINGAVANNAWSHHVFTWDGARVRYYRNGALGLIYDNTTWADSFASASASAFPSQTSVIIGDSFQGRIEQPLIFSRALTDNDVSELYNSGAGIDLDLSTAPFSQSLVTGFRLAENTGASVTDIVSGHAATVSGVYSWDTDCLFTESSPVRLLFGSAGYIAYGTNGLVLNARELGNGKVLISGDTRLDGSLTLGGVSHTNWPSGGLSASSVSNIVSEVRELHTDSFTNIIWRSVYSNGWTWLVAYTNTPAN